MINYIQLFIGILGLAAFGLYCSWVRFRVLWLRQELFAIRDRLWDEARDLNALDDAAYREMRATLNSMIRTAHHLNLPVLAYMTISSTPEKPPISDRHEVTKAIERAIDSSVTSIVRYVINFRPISGWLLCTVILTTASIQSTLTRWFVGGGPRALDASLGGA